MPCTNWIVSLLAPMVDYLRWLASVLAARAIPGEHLALSLDWLAEFFVAHMNPADGATVNAALHAAREKFMAASDLPLVRSSARGMRSALDRL